MEVEVKQPEGYYLKAFVNDITDAGLDVVYERGWRKPELVNFARCRAMVAEVVQKSNFKAGDIVDAYLKIGKDDDINAWYKMKIREIKGEYVILDGVEDANRNDVILLNQCRHPALTTQITSTTVKSCTIPVNDDLLDYFARGDESLKLLQESIPNILMKLDRTAKELVIKSFSMGAIKKVGMLRDAFLSNSRQKMALLQRQEEQKKMLSVEEPIHNAALCIDFEVSTDFMGLAIGSQGANIQNARALEGIKEVILDESMRDHGFCKFKVYAENAEAAEQARNMLEFLQQHKMVPQGKVGQVIGKQGKTIQDIVDKSGVVRVQIGDENPEQGMVPFTFTGTREAISNAELMVEFQLKHIIEMDEIRAEEDEIRRKLYMSRNSPFLHYNNNGGGHHVPFNRPQHQQNNMRRINGGGPGGGNRPPQQDGEDQQQQQPHQQQQRRMGGSGGPGGGFRSSGGPRGPPRFNQNQQQGGGVDGPRGDRGGPVGNRFRGGPGGGGNQQQRRDGGGQPRRQFQGQNHFFQQKPRNQQQQQRDHNQQHENNDQQPPQQQQYDASPPRAKRMVESDEEVSSNEGTNSGAAISKNE